MARTDIRPSLIHPEQNRWRLHLAVAWRKDSGGRLPQPPWDSASVVAMWEAAQMLNGTTMEAGISALSPRLGPMTHKLRVLSTDWQLPTEWAVCFVAPVAYHEAGHAVFMRSRLVHRSRPIPVEFATVMPLLEEGGGSVGRPGDYQYDVRQRERQALADLAGAVCESLYLGVRPTLRGVRMSHPDDWREAHAFCTPSCNSKAQHRAYLVWLFQSALETAKHPSVWARVQAVAERLIANDQLTGREVAKAMRSARVGEDAHHRWVKRRLRFLGSVFSD